jgi:dihydroorotate dehydrogenase
MRKIAALPGLMSAFSKLLTFHSPLLETHLLGAHFPNPVGLAAGFDKTGGLYPFLGRAGFGFVECGTFTAEGQPGNPRPRLARFPREQALVNQMGFNNPGAAAAAKTFLTQPPLVPRGISIGKTRVTALQDTANDHRKSIQLLAPFADYIALNISSPNTPGLRELELPQLLGTILRAAIADLGSTVPLRPLLIKLAPDQSGEDFDASVATALEAGAAGLILTNTTLDRTNCPDLASIPGGVSGAPLRQRSTELVRRARRIVGAEVPIVGVGGIFSGEHALEKLRAGATMIQVYSGYVFEGPALPRKIVRYLDGVCRRDRLVLADLVGSAP